MNRTTATVAIDSMPLSSEPADCRDYSGSQVFALTTGPLVAPMLRSETQEARPVVARVVETSADATRHRFVLRQDVRAPSGDRISAHRYASAIEALLARRPATPETFWLRQISAIDATDESLVIVTRRPHPRLPALTSLFPLCAGPGRYTPPQIADRSSSRITLSRNPGWPDPELADVVDCVHVKSPEDNVRLYGERVLDLTADTAFPFDRVAVHLDDPDFRATSVGIFMALAFEGALAEPSAVARRREIQKAVASSDPSRRLGGVLIPTDRFLPYRGDLHARLRESLTHVFDIPSTTTSATPAIRLAYDPYYPNELVCRILKQRLDEAGIETRLVEDSFEERHAEADLRLVLVRGLRSGELSVYHGLLFEPLLRSDRARLARYLELLDREEATSNISVAEVEETGAGLQAILDELCVIVPLCEVPGLSLTRLSHTPWSWRERTRAEPA